MNYARTNERAILELIAKMKENGNYLREIAQTLNDAKIPTPRGKMWQPVTVSRAYKDFLRGYNSYAELKNRCNIRN
jgi:hypothetical protein